MTRREQSNSRRRAGTIVTAAITLPVLIGFAALAVDVGVIYNARTELQRAADAGALAAAAVLAEAGVHSTGATEAAREEAERFVALNRVLGRTMSLDSSDIEFGRGVPDEETGAYSFVPTISLPDAVRVRVRMTDDSPNGALPLFFAAIFGRHQTNVSAVAAAAVAPRDIAIVADLSASHNDDSELSHYQITSINMHEMWDDLPGGADEDDGGIWDLNAIPSGWVMADGSIPQAAGPGWGYFQKLGFGELEIDSSYSPLSDPGLTHLPYNANWTDGALRSSLAARGYNTNEINALMSRANDSSGAYEYRTAVALGLAEWNSGMSGGRWQVQSLPKVGNNNTSVNSSEVQWTQSVFEYTLNQSRDLWLDYIGNYMGSTTTDMYDSNPGFRYRFGIKTFVNYLLERRPTNGNTPEFATAAQQPMQAVKDAVTHLTTTLAFADSNDLMSLEIYGTTARHEIDLTNDFMLISNRLNAMQAGFYDQNTNMGGGIRKGIQELQSSRARPTSRKIMVLLTDGKANISATGSFTYAGGRQYALVAAEEAAEAGILIFTVSVGADADVPLMEQIAEMGSGKHFRAAGSIDEYSEELADIFNTIGGLRSAELIE